MTNIAEATALDCPVCPLYEPAPTSGQICRRCGRGRNWWHVPPLLVWAAVTVIIARLTAMILGAELLSWQRDFQQRGTPHIGPGEPLALYCRWPLNIDDYPAQLLILAALLAATIATPLVVARLFGRPAALALLVLSATLGSFPYLTAALLPGVLVMSSAWRLAQWPLAGLLIAVFPVGLMALFLTDPSSQLPSRSPAARWIAYAPALMAAPLAIMAAWLVLTTSRWLGYRLWWGPLLAGVLAAVPLGGFALTAGPQALDHARLVAHHDPRVRFAPIASRESLNAELARRGIANFQDWWDGPDDPSQLGPTELAQLLLARLQRETHHACASFLRDYTSGPHAAEATFFAAVAADTIVDSSGLDSSGLSPTTAMVFRLGPPTPQGLAWWKQLADRHGDHPLVVGAYLRLAQHDYNQATNALARDDLAQAALKYQAAIDRLDALPELYARVRGMPRTALSDTALERLLTGFGVRAQNPHASRLAAWEVQARWLRLQLESNWQIP